MLRFGLLPLFLHTASNQKLEPGSLRMRIVLKTLMVTSRGGTIVEYLVGAYEQRLIKEAISAMQTEICENDHNHKPFRLLNLWEKGRGEGTFTISSRRSMLAGVDTDGAKLFLNEEATFHSANCMFVYCTIERSFIHAIELLYSCQQTTT